MSGAGLEPEEVDALMSAIRDGRTPLEGNAAQLAAIPYDLTSQDRIIRGQMPTLDAINEAVASVLGTGLAGRTRLAIRVSAAPTTLLKFVDFNGLLGSAGAICVLSLGPGFGLALCMLEPGVAEALLSAALGDRKPKVATQSTEARRELTSVEQLVLRRLLTIHTTAMAQQWENVLPLKPEVLRFEHDPRLAVIAPPNELAVVTTFEISGAISGRMQFVIPYATLEPVKQRLAAPAQLSKGGDGRFTDALADELAQVRVELCALLGKTTVPFSRVLELAVGDVLLLSTEESAELQILVQGRPKLVGRPLVSSGTMAITIAHKLAPRPDAAQPPSRRIDGPLAPAA